MEESSDNMILLVCGLALLWYLHTNGYLSFSCGDSKEHFSPLGNMGPIDHRYLTNEQYYIAYLISLLKMQGLDSGNPEQMESIHDTAAANSNYRALQVLPIALRNGGKAFGPFPPYGAGQWNPDLIQNNGSACAY